MIYKSKFLSFFLSISLSFDLIQTYDLFVNCFELFASAFLFWFKSLDFSSAGSGRVRSVPAVVRMASGEPVAISLASYCLSRNKEETIKCCDGIAEALEKLKTTKRDGDLLWESYLSPIYYFVSWMLTNGKTKKLPYPPLAEPVKRQDREIYQNWTIEVRERIK